MTLSAPPSPAFLTCSQVRAIDQRAAEHGLSTLALMENAGRGAAQLLLALGIHGPVVILCGKGNNGGDGLVMARHLHNAEVDVTTLLLADPATLSADAAGNWRILTHADIRCEVWPVVDEQRLRRLLARSEWVVDALFGTGLQGKVRPPFDRVITLVNASAARVLAIDIPSGLNGDTGEAPGPTVRARDTATFVASKTGFANPAAADWLGKVHVIDIGVPAALVQQVLTS